MEFWPTVLAILGSGTVTSMAVAIVKGWQQRKRARESTPFLEDVLRHSRLKWRDYAYELSGILKSLDGEVPDPPDDPFQEALKSRDLPA